MKKILTIVAVLVVLGSFYYWMQGSSNQNQGEKVAETLPSSGGNESMLSQVSPRGPLGIVSIGSIEHLTDRNGLTLYVNTKDAGHTGGIKPTCTGTCEKTWLPFLVTSAETVGKASSDPLLKKLNIFKRADGRGQYALGTEPLYRYSGDSKIGEMFGNQIGTWLVARP